MERRGKGASSVYTEVKNTTINNIFSLGSSRSCIVSLILSCWEQWNSVRFVHGVSWSRSCQVDWLILLTQCSPTNTSCSLGQMSCKQVGSLPKLNRLFIVIGCLRQGRIMA